MAPDTVTGSLVVVGTTFGSAWYTLHVIAAQPRGRRRVLAALPVFAANLLLPCVVDPRENGVGSIILSTFFGWWANFKVLALCWGRGPLASTRSATMTGPDDSDLAIRPMGLLEFTARMALPIVIRSSAKPELKAEDRESREERAKGDAEGARSGTGLGNSLLENEPDAVNPRVPGNGAVNGRVTDAGRELVGAKRAGTERVPLSESSKLAPLGGEQRSPIIAATLGKGPATDLASPSDDPDGPWHSLALQSLGSLVLFNALIYLLDLRPHLPELVVVFIYCIIMYTHMLFMFNGSAAAMKACAGLSLAPHFRRPYLSSSLQDFWSHRWNLVSGALLREAVFAPLKESLQRLSPSGHPLPRFLSTSVAIVVTFLVSGILHEFILYHAVSHLNGFTWEWMAFFSLHGFLLVAEIGLKKTWSHLGGKVIPKAVSVPFTLLILVGTAQIFFFPPMTRNGFDVQAIAEFRSLLPGRFNRTSNSIVFFSKDEL